MLRQRRPVESTNGIPDRVGNYAVQAQDVARLDGAAAAFAAPVVVAGVDDVERLGGVAPRGARSRRDGADGRMGKDFAAGVVEDLGVEDEMDGVGAVVGRRRSYTRAH